MASKCKTVLITTTIHVPQVLGRYRELGPEVRFIVAGDRKTPHAEAREFIESLGNACYLSDQDQVQLGYECSEVIGWNKIMRRNLALLEAIRLRPEIIISIDDDNLPIGSDYFESFQKALGSSYAGVMATSPAGWFNVGALIWPAVFHRGFSYEQRSGSTQCQFRPVVGKRVGVAAGLWLGDPDIDAMDRIVNQPVALHFSDLLHQGVLVDHRVFCPFNSQNTGFLAELAPLMMVLVGVGRYDDIWASYIAERVMRDFDCFVHYGQPYVWQERNPQNRWKNLKDEIFGMEFTPQFCRDLEAMDLGDGGVLDKLDRLYRQLNGKSYVPPVVLELGEAWVRDVRRALSG